MKPANLITLNGRFEKKPRSSAAPHRQRRQMMRHGCCLTLSWSKARAMRGYLNVDPDKPMRALVCPTVEGVAELFTAINGSDATAEELARTELTRGNLIDAPRPKVQRTDD